MKITEYNVVKAQNCDSLIKYMNIILNKDEGWEPLGPPQLVDDVDSPFFLQTLVKVDRSQEATVAEHINDIHSVMVQDVQNAAMRWTFLNT